MSKRSYATAFPNIATGFGSAIHLGWKAYKRYKDGSYTLNGPQKNMAGNRYGYRKRFRSGTRTIQRRRRKFRRGNVKRRIRKVWRFLKSKGIRSIESKYTQAANVTSNSVDGATAIGTLNDTGANIRPYAAKLLFANNIFQGTGTNGRVGNKIFLRKLRWQAMVEASLSANAVNEVYVTIMILRVKQMNSSWSTQLVTAPFVQNVFEFIGNTADPGVPVNITDSALAYISGKGWMNNKWRNDFEILMLKRVKVSKETGSDQQKKIIKKTITINKPCYYDNGEPQDGHIFGYWWCDQVTPNGVVAVGDRPILRYAYRLTYTDV